MLIMAKTKKPVLCADEAELSEEPPEELEALIKAAVEEIEEIEDTSAIRKDMEVSFGKSLLKDFRYNKASNCSELLCFVTECICVCLYVSTGGNDTD